MTTKSIPTAVVTVSGLLLLLGCGSQISGGAAAEAPTSQAQSSPGLTRAPDKPVGTVLPPPRKQGPVKPGDFAPKVVWKHDTLIVTAFGSSTCRPVADEAVAYDEHTLVVRFGGPPDGVACTDDYGPTRSRIPAPTDGIDLDSKVYAAFELEGTPPGLIPVRLIHPVLN